MQRAVRAVAMAAILGTLLLPTDASAQLDATDNPTKTGPLARDGGDCKTDRARSGGSLAAVSKSCSDAYSFNPQRENKPGRDYGAVWLQGSVKTEPGWCARAATMTLRVPRGVRIEDRTPSFKRTEDPQRVRARIVVNADGTAEENGVVKNHFRLFPNFIKPDVDGRTFTLDWRGNTARNLGFAMGVEISWDADEGFPNRSPRGSVVSTLRAC
jgi:hypothetical protein